VCVCVCVRARARLPARTLLGDIWFLRWTYFHLGVDIFYSGRWSL